MGNESYADKVFSAQQVPPLALGHTLSISNNAHHPVLTPTRHGNYEAAHIHLTTAIAELEHAFAELSKEPDIKLGDFKTAYALINGYRHVIEQTFFVNAARAPRPVNGLVL